MVRTNGQGWPFSVRLISMCLCISISTSIRISTSISTSSSNSISARTSIKSIGSRSLGRSSSDKW